MVNERTAPEVRFDGFTEPWIDYKFKEVISMAERPFDMEDNGTYQCVTAKRRNGGIYSRGFLEALIF